MADAVLPLQPQHDGVELLRVHRGADQGGDELHRILPPLDDHDVARRVVRRLELVQQQLPHCRHRGGVGGQPHLIGRLRCALVEGDAVDGIGQQPQQHIAHDDEEGQQRGLRHHVGPGAGADTRGAPERRGRVQAADIHPFLHDHAGAKEADAGDDIGDDARGLDHARDARGQVDEGGRADRDQHAGPEAGGALPVLPLRADQRAEDEGRGQADHAVEEGVEIEARDEPHGLTAEFGTGGSRVTVRDAPSASGEVVGSEVHTGDGMDTIIMGSGNDTVFAGAMNDFVDLGAGDDVMFGVRGQDTILAGSGNDTIEVAEGDVFASKESGTLTFVAARDATVLGGSGSATIHGGTGGGLFVGGTSGNNSMTAGEGATTLIGGGAGDILYANGRVGDMLVAGPGNTTLIGGASSGDNTYKLGSGDDLVQGGPLGRETIIAGGGDDTVFGGGFNTYSFINDLTTGGTMLITDFWTGFDHVHVEGYEGGVDAVLASQMRTETGTTVTLSDGTQISFLGLDELKRDDFV